MEKKVGILFVLLFILCFGSGCTKSFVMACREMAVEEGGGFQYTQDQAKAACADANRFLAGTFDKDKGFWSMDYTRVISTEEVLTYVQDQLKSIDILLSYDYPENARDIDFWKGFRRGFERKEKELRWVEQRLLYVVNYNQFVDKVGEKDGETVKKLMPYGRKAYSLRLIYPLNEIKELKFTADYVESAKKDGALVLVNEFPIVEQKKFSEKIIDKDDPNKFSWRSHHRGWLIRAYKILPQKEQPVKANIDYLEIYKAKFSPGADDGKKFESFEEQFAVSGFKAGDKEGVNIFVIDYDWEAIKGFSPDKVLETYVNIIFGNEIYTIESLKREVLEVLYNPPIAEQKEYRKKPPEKPLFVEVAKMGEVTVELWETSAEGFAVPFLYSSQGPGKLDVSFEISWRKPMNGKDEQVESEHGLKQIEVFKQIFKKGSVVKVVEYYTPKDEYAKRSIKEGMALYNIIRIRRKDKPQEEADIRYFADKLRTIDYEYGGRWYRILDKDGDGKFEKRQKIADSQNKNGNNSVNGMLER